MAGVTRLERKTAFQVVGVKTFVESTEDIAAFWRECQKDGTIESLQALTDRPGKVTDSVIFGLSRVEENPEAQRFDYYICTEYEGSEPAGMESFLVPEASWAIFSVDGKTPFDAIKKAKEYAFGTWMKDSDNTFRHDRGPEIEVFTGEMTGEFWMPVVREWAWA